MPYYNQGPPPVVPEPGFHYHWIADDPERLADRLTPQGSDSGYRLLQGKTVAETKVLATAHGQHPEQVNELTNRITYGRLILGRIPLAEAQRRTREQLADARDKLAATKETYENQFRRRGLNPFVMEKEEYDDRKSFAQRESNNRVSVPDAVAKVANAPEDAK